ncbi:hypothetical protein GCM10007856_03970 [Azospirillum oryzae]|nr:hypothetical protein GCM10007856_03970 [Azospirillum oryzae]
MANTFRMGAALDAACAAIKTKLLTAPVIASDETTTRVDGVTHGQRVFPSDEAVLHTIAPSRGRAVAADIQREHRPELWVSNRYAGQQELGQAHQVCLAHLLRDIQYAVDCGDSVAALKLCDQLRWVIRVGKQSPELKDSALAVYAAKAERRLDNLLGVPAAHSAGRKLQRKIKAWRGKFFVFISGRRLPPTTDDVEKCESSCRPMRSAHGVDRMLARRRMTKPGSRPQPRVSAGPRSGRLDAGGVIRHAPMVGPSRRPPSVHRRVRHARHTPPRAAGFP